MDYTTKLPTLSLVRLIVKFHSVERVNKEEPVLIVHPSGIPISEYAETSFLWLGLSWLQVAKN